MAGFGKHGGASPCPKLVASGHCSQIGRKWRQTTGYSRFFLRHPELVSGSMAGRLLQRSARSELRPWMLKQVQHDGIGKVRSPFHIGRSEDD